MNVKSQYFYVFFSFFNAINYKFINKVNEIELNNYAIKMEKRGNYEFRLV